MAVSARCILGMLKSAKWLCKAIFRSMEYILMIPKSIDKKTNDILAKKMAVKSNIGFESSWIPR